MAIGFYVLADSDPLDPTPTGELLDVHPIDGSSAPRYLQHYKDAPSVVWSNHDSYFEPDEESSRLSILDAIKGGATGLGAFFAAGADTNFQYLQIKNNEPANPYCHSLLDIDTVQRSWDNFGGGVKMEIGIKTPIYVRLDDKFELVGFRKGNGVWQKAVREISGEEAIAFILTDNRFASRNRRIYKTAEVYPTPESCIQELTSFTDAVFGQLLPLIDDPAERERAAEAVRHAVNFSIYDEPSIGTPMGVIDERTSDVIRAIAASDEPAKKLDEKKVEIYLRLAKAYAKAMEKEGLPPLKAVDEITAIEIFQTIETLKKGLEYVPYPSPLHRLSIDASKLEYDYRSLKYAQDVLQRQSGGATNLLQCKFKNACFPTEGPSQNRWLEAEEAAIFVKAVYRVVLPSIGDPKERDAVRMAVETAVKKAGDLNGVPLAEIEEGISNTIRAELNKNVERLAAQKVVLHKELTDALISARGIPTLVDERGLPEIPEEIGPIDKISTEEMKAAARSLIIYVRAKIPRQGASGDVLAFLEQRLFPLRDNIYLWAASYDVAMKTQNYLAGQPSGPIALMAAGATDDFGGFLPESGEVVIGLPTEALENGARLSMQDIAEADPDGEELERDWAALIRQWQKEGLLDIRPPKMPPTDTVSALQYGKRKVPLKDAGTSVPYESYPAVTSRLQKDIDTIGVNANFGKKYLEELAGRGISEVVIVPSSYLARMMQAEASSLAREGARLFKSDAKTAISMLKAAAVKFSYLPGGMYIAKGKRILLGEGLYYGSTFLHEMAHTDERVRRDAGILGPNLLAEVNRLQNEFLWQDDNTVSNHPEVVFRSPSAAEERRADAMALYWTRPERLAGIDPDLTLYFDALTRVFEAKDLKVSDEQVDGSYRYERGERLISGAAPFSKGAGNLVLWAVQHMYSGGLVHVFACLKNAGDTNNWMSIAQDGCKMVFE